MKGKERNNLPPPTRNPRGKKAAERHEVLDADELHVLRAAAKDLAVLVEVAGEGSVALVPLVVLRGHDVVMPVEEHGGERGVPPLDPRKHHGLARHHPLCLGENGGGELEGGLVVCERGMVSGQLFRIFNKVPFPSLPFPSIPSPPPSDALRIISSAIARKSSAAWS